MDFGCKLSSHYQGSAITALLTNTKVNLTYVDFGMARGDRRAAASQSSDRGSQSGRGISTDRGGRAHWRCRERSCATERQDAASPPRAMRMHANERKADDPLMPLSCPDAGSGT